MDVHLLNGKTARLNLRGKALRSQSRSQFQHRIGQQLAKQYPHDLIFEEVTVPGEGFVLDFFIPSLKLVVECHGKQHIEHVRHFHKTKHEFHQQQIRDQRKRDWCALNSFRLEEIQYE